MTRSELSTSHFWARRRTRARPSKPSASHAGCAARAARASSATCSAVVSRTWAMTSPVAGFSTAISPAAVAVPLVAGCSSTVATALAPTSFDGVSNTTVGRDVARRTRPRRPRRALPRLAHGRGAPALALHPLPVGGRGHARRVLSGQSRAALRARLARRPPRPAPPRLPVRDLRLPPPGRADLLRRVRVGRGHRLGLGTDRGPPRRAARPARARVRAGAPSGRGGDRRRARGRPRRARRARRRGGALRRAAAAHARPLAREGHCLDADRLDRAVAAVGLRRADALDHVLTAGDLAEDRVLAVQPGALVRGDDEELRPVGVRPRVGHGQRPAHDLVVVDLVLELVAGTARAGALRAAALDHEVGDDAVEDEPVVEALTGELLEVADGLRGVLVEQLEGDLAFARLHHGLGHGDSSGSSGTGRWARALSRAARARRCAGAVRRWAAG